MKPFIHRYLVMTRRRSWELYLHRSQQLVPRVPALRVVRFHQQCPAVSWYTTLTVLNPPSCATHPTNLMWSDLSGSKKKKRKLGVSYVCKCEMYIVWGYRSSQKRHLQFWKWDMKGNLLSKYNCYISSCLCSSVAWYFVPLIWYKVHRLKNPPFYTTWYFSV